MKKYVLLGVIALVILLAVPAAMAADLAVSGNVDKPAIDVSIVGYASPSFGGMISGAACNPVSPPDMPDVKADVSGNGVTSWSVKAATADVGIGAPYYVGMMWETTTHSSLNDYFLLGRNSDGVYQDLHNPWESFMSGTTKDGSPFTQGLRMKQCINPALDQDGNYKIDISFTGTINE